MAISNFFYLSILTIEFLIICGYHIYPNSFFQCRLNFYIENLSRSMSTFFSVGIAIDRLIRSEIPLRSRIICTRKNTFIIAIIIFILFSIFWSFYLLPYSSENPLTNICMYNQSASFEFFLVNINIPLRAVLFCLLPILIMIVANIRMMNNIRQVHHRIAAVPQINPGNKSSAMISSAAVSEQPGRRTLVIDRMLLYMLTASVLTFIITQIPFHLYMVIRVYIDDYTHLLIYAVLLIWSSIYFGIAFYLYCLASPLFRKKSFRIIRKLLRCQICRITR